MVLSLGFSIIHLIHTGKFMAHAAFEPSVTVIVTFLANIQAPSLVLETDLHKKPITAMCIGHGRIGRMN